MQGFICRKTYFMCQLSTLWCQSVLVAEAINDGIQIGLMSFFLLFVAFPESCVDLTQARIQGSPSKSDSSKRESINSGH